MKKYMIPRLTFVSFSPSVVSTSYDAPVVLYNVIKASNSNMHIKSKIQNTKIRMETKNMLLSFLIKKS